MIILSLLAVVAEAVGVVLVAELMGEPLELAGIELERGNPLRREQHTLLQLAQVVAGVQAIVVRQA